jgi:hypothetical protein
MAVYQGARPMASALILPRRRQPVRRRARRSTNRVGLALAAILIAFLLGLFYLTQTIGTATAGYDIDNLAAHGQLLQQQIQTLDGDLARWAAEPAIVSGAQQRGLGHLGEGLRVPAR